MLVLAKDRVPAPPQSISIGCGGVSHVIFHLRLVNYGRYGYVNVEVI